MQRTCPGSCEYCLNNRLHSTHRRELDANDQIQEFNMYGAYEQREPTEQEESKPECLASEDGQHVALVHGENGDIELRIDGRLVCCVCGDRFDAPKL